MKFLLLINLTLTVLLSFGYSIPDECKPENYKELTEQFRVLDYRSDTIISHTDGTPKNGNQTLVPGWYRFNVVAQRMLQRNELQDEYGYFGTETFKPCGATVESLLFFFEPIQNGRLTSPFYVLDGDHPSEEYGLKLSIAIGCKYRAVVASTDSSIITCDTQNGQNCTWELICDGNNDRVEIAVRKCSGFFVYLLQPTAAQPFTRLTQLGPPRQLKDGIYCGTKQIEAPMPVMDSQCKKYRSYYDHTRQWSHLGPIFDLPLCNDDLDTSPQMGFLHEQWTRFYNSTSDNTTMRLPEDCPSFTEDYSELNGKFYCAAQYRGWLLGNHPAVHEGAVDRKLCFSDTTTCRCQMSSVISIVNCGDFYLYRRRKRGFPDCFARACTVPDERTDVSFVSNLTPSQSVKTSSTNILDIKSMSSSDVYSDMKTQEVMSSKSSTMNSPLATWEIMSSKSSTMNSSIATWGIVSNKSSTVNSLMATWGIMSSKSSTMNSPMATWGIMSSKSSTINSPMATWGIMSSKSSAMNSSSKINSTTGIMASESLMNHSIMEKVESTPMMSSMTLINPTKSMLFSEKTVVEKKEEAILETTTTTLTTTMDTILKEAETLDLCTNTYKTIVDDTRLASFASLLSSGCDKQYYPAVRFVTSKGEDLQLLEGCQNSDQFKRACSSRGNVWLQGNHPQNSFAEAKVLCMKTTNTAQNPIDPAYCTCQEKQLIIVQKCSTYFVYRLYSLFPTLFPAQSRECIFRYCTEKVPGTQPTISTTTKSIDKKKEIFSLDGSFQILNPFVNGAPVRKEDIADATSDTYQFLVDIVTDMLKQATKELDGITSIEILGFRIGSLITEYKMSGTEILPESTIKETLSNHFTRNPGFDVATETNSFSGIVNASSQQFTAVDQCLSKPCHQNATCTNQPANNTFFCHCNDNYQGDGFTCDRLIEVTVTKEKVVTEWSTSAIIIVAAVFGVCFVLIIILAFCLCCRSSHSYSTRGAFHRGGNLDNYYSTEAPSKDKTLTVPVAHNMYMTSEPSDGTTTFSEKYQMDSLDKQNSNFMK